MSTIDKALRLLGQFNHTQPEFGLSELSRVTGFDKATTLRLARSLVGSGLLEQDPVSRRYRLGAEILRLANLREGTFPLRKIAQPVARALAEMCGETAHVSARTGDKLGTVLTHESTQTLRVIVEPGLRLPWHATASGFALLAELKVEDRTQLIAANANDANDARAPAFTDELDRIIADTVERGYAVSTDRLEKGVAGIAAAYFDNRDIPIGSIAVAFSSSALTPEREAEFSAWVVKAASELSAQLGSSKVHKSTRPGSTGPIS